jgi:hypothetical protein
MLRGKDSDKLSEGTGEIAYGKVFGHFRENSGQSGPCPPPGPAGALPRADGCCVRVRMNRHPVGSPGPGQARQAERAEPG